MNICLRRVIEMRGPDTISNEVLAHKPVTSERIDQKMEEVIDKEGQKLHRSLGYASSGG